MIYDYYCKKYLYLFVNVYSDNNYIFNFDATVIYICTHFVKQDNNIHHI